MRKRIVMIIMAAALVALPTMAQQDQWQSTSTMQGSGSTYSSQVTGVGASGVDNMATTTTDSYSPANAGRRKDKIGGAETGKSTESPVGDALIPLMLFACAYLIIRAMRRKNIEKA